MLKFKYPFFDRYSSWCGEAACLTIATDYAVAGDNQRQRIFSECITDSSACSGSGCSFR